MCILKPCPNPTGVGVWWRDDTKWCLYANDKQHLIRSSVSQGLKSIDLGMISSTVHANGACYTADLRAMEQVAVSSGQRRGIMIIDAAVPAMPKQIDKSPLLTIAPPPKSPGFAPKVHYRDSSGQLRQYDSEIAKALLQQFASGSQRTLVLQDKVSRRHLLFDLETMEQRFVVHCEDGEHVETGEGPFQVVVELPWNPEALVSLVEDAESSLRRKILCLTVERYRSEEFLDVTLPSKAHPRTILSTKRDGFEVLPGHPRYESFVDSVEVALGRFPKAIEAFIQSASTGGDGDHSAVQIVFTTTRRKSSDGTEGTAFWKNMMVPIAAAHAVVYGNAIELMISAYLVILPSWGKSIMTRHSHFSSVEVEQPHHRLPLALVTVR